MNTNCFALQIAFATTEAYSVAAYIYSSVNRKAIVNLVIPKHVAPAKQLSILRLKVLNVLIRTRCLHYLTQQLQLPVVEGFMWTDAQCVLCWMKTYKPLPVFVQNRLREITSNMDFKLDYVSTSQNPADLATRGVPTNKLIRNNLRWHSLSWLTDHPSKWPLSKRSIQFDSKMPEQNTKLSLGHMLCMTLQH